MAISQHAAACYNSNNRDKSSIISSASDPYTTDEDSDYIPDEPNSAIEVQIVITNFVAVGYKKCKTNISRYHIFHHFYKCFSSCMFLIMRFWKRM